VEWNFANDVGLHKGGRPEACTLVQAVDKGKVGIFASRVKKALEHLNDAWQDSRMK